MNTYEKIRLQITPYLPEAGTIIGELVFLSPDAFWRGEVQGCPFLAVAEDRWPDDNGGTFLAVTTDGPVYIADLDDNQFLDYCAASFPQFIEIMNRFLTILKTHESPSVFDEEGLRRCEEEEKWLRQEINHIDAAAIQDPDSFWSVMAEEIGAGF